MALFKMYCTCISATPMFPPSRRRTSANPPAQSPKTGSRRRPSSPVMVPASSLSTPVPQPGDAAASDPVFQLHNNIFEDMKSLIHPIAVSIASVNARLNDMEKRVASNSAAIAISPGSALATFTLATVSSGPARPVPAADVATYNLATAALNVPQQAPVVRNHILAPHLRRQIFEGKDINLVSILIANSDCLDHSRLRGTSLSRLSPATPGCSKIVPWGNSCLIFLYIGTYYALPTLITAWS
ncbi:UNVERIFIED_CONTAM: hypothetical protein FKN15_037533 [Acipenser sinensis]